jgi:hypothetical protein
MLKTYALILPVWRPGQGGAPRDQLGQNRTTASVASASPVTLVNVLWMPEDWSLSVKFNFWLFATIVLLTIAIIAWRLSFSGFSWKEFEIDEAEIGVGQQKLHFKPNLTDKQVAYAIWVELSTRKIGLEIDFDNNVIAEIYDSWFNFFSVTRELLKGISVSQVRSDSTQKIISLSIDVLNKGLRPHLTRWQARFRNWYDRALKRFETTPDSEILDPQALQATFPKYAELKADMERVNHQLIAYRAKMRSLVFKN